MKHGTEFDKPEEVTQEDLPKGVVLRDHVVDGIREYDQSLPKWWLMILFGVILFSIIYWFLGDQHKYTGGDKENLETKLAALETKKLANSIDVTDDARFFEMSHNDAFVQAGKATFEANCIACHGKDLQGGIGFNLVDEEWVHGSNPSEIYTSVANGFQDKGMLPWEPIIGQKRIAEVVAYLLSKNPNLEQ